MKYSYSFINERFLGVSFNESSVNVRSESSFAVKANNDESFLVKI